MTKLVAKGKVNKTPLTLKVRIIKSPLVDSAILKAVLSQRQKALVL